LKKKKPFLACGGTMSSRFFHRTGYYIAMVVTMVLVIPCTADFKNPFLSENQLAMFVVQLGCRTSGNPSYLTVKFLAAK